MRCACVVEPVLQLTMNNVGMDYHSQTGSMTVKWFDLCIAASAGDYQKVKALIHDGVDVEKADYDKRWVPGRTHAKPHYLTVC